MELRCNTCKKLKDGFCLKLQKELDNNYVKFESGGAKGAYSGLFVFKSKCGIEESINPETEELATFYVLYPTEILQ